MTAKDDDPRKQRAARARKTVLKARREALLAEALRENLRRRKAQARARAQDKGDKGDKGGEGEL
ncbi:MAG: hypothetical protein A3G73_01955 [Rhodospirillales bacterium RIFCSPLOWO2_12_FULL_67_15]|nr:MAG: hypothetical protein A3G73_01955 [Rhodospirillales bacterium RIFCSPLOWO2_12_FULL_67_15]